MKHFIFFCVTILFFHWSWGFSRTYPVSQIPVPKSLKSSHKGNLQITIDIHIPRATQLELPSVLKEIQLAQKVWRQCQIDVQVSKIFSSDFDPDMALDFETYSFYHYAVSDDEKALFDNPSMIERPTVTYVGYIDWSYDIGGTRAISYPEFILPKVAKADLNFFRSKMLGSVILGQLRDESTLAHELGHSLFNLKHSSQNKNLMIGTVLGKRKYYQLTGEQCQWAQKAAAGFNSKINSQGISN